jgi:hypothetical protein
MWWNLNPTCNIFCQRCYIYSIYILIQFNNKQDTRINEPAVGQFGESLTPSNVGLAKVREKPMEEEVQFGSSGMFC